MTPQWLCPGKPADLYGAPSHWMRRWIGDWPIYIDDKPRPYGVRFADVDGNDDVASDEPRRADHSVPQQQRTMARIALGRMALPAEVAAVCAFLASDDASFVNGAALVVDGGARVPAGARAH